MCIAVVLIFLSVNFRRISNSESIHTDKRHRILIAVETWFALEEELEVPPAGQEGTRELYKNLGK